MIELDTHILIGLSDVEGEYAGRYTRWLSSIDSRIETVPLLSAAHPLTALESCSALLLPGGGDPAPQLYGMEDPGGLCDVEADRDRHEFTLIRAAIDRRLPILGICRGLQIMNVALGGSLLLDLPLAGIHGHHKINGTDQMHDISIRPGTLLHEISGADHALVNSAHHQGVDLVASRLRVSSTAADGQPESLEWKHPEQLSFLLLLHWHPERLNDAPGTVSTAIGRAFLDAAHRRGSEV